MAQTKPDSSEANDFSSQEYKNSASKNGTNFSNTWSVDQLDTEGVNAAGETTYMTKWSLWHGYYRAIPEMSAPIDKKALWTVGEGFDYDPKTPERTRRVFSNLKGYGKDTTLGILSNAVRVYTIGGDFYAEIIKDNQGRLINLKPLNPGTVEIVVGENGMISHYNQTMVVAGDTQRERIDKEDMFHLPWNRIADEIHGIPTFQDLEETIEFYKESKLDMRVVFHRYVKPLLITEVDTDDPTEIAAFKAKIDNAQNKGENMIVPKGVANVNRVSIPQFSTLDPLPWQRSLLRIFLMKEGVPAIVLGQSSEEDTEASSKIVFIGYEALARWNQTYLESQIEAQLGIKLKFRFTRSLLSDLQKDEKKDNKSEKPDLNDAKKRD